MRVQKGYQKNFCQRFLSGMAFLFLFFLMGTGISHAEGRWEQEGQSWYYYSSDNKESYTGWVQSSTDGRWYFCLNSKMQTGWVSWNGKWYFLNSDGAMAEKQYVGNFYLGEDGAALISAETPDQRKTSENGSLLRKGKPMQELNEKTAKYISVLMEHPDAKVFFDSPNQLSLEEGNGYPFVIFKKMSLYDRKSGELLYAGDAAFHKNAVIEYNSGSGKKMISVMDLMMIRGVAGERVFIDPAGYITYVSGRRGMTLQQLRQVIAVADYGSMNEAAKQLYLTQPSLSATIKAVEREIGIEIFTRSNRGIIATPEGEEFLGYARQVSEQYQLMEDKYLSGGPQKKKFSVSMQHYTFAVEAFIRLLRQYEENNVYEFSVFEGRTIDVIENVRKQISELGIIYENDFNENVIGKILREGDLEFVPLFSCKIYVFMAKSNPLAKKKLISMEDLMDYPCCTFDQGERNSFYFAEEVLSTYDYKKFIKVNDRATILNLMVGLNGYTLCSGIICQELNGPEYIAIPLDTEETMRIGYIKNKKMHLSELGKKYVEELQKYKVQEETDSI